MYTRNFRYSFDDEGYYTGIVRPSEVSFGLKVFPENSTDQEPPFKEGFLPRWSTKEKDWILEKRGERRERHAFERYLKVYESKIDPINRELLRVIASNNSLKSEIERERLAIHGRMSELTQVVSSMGSRLRDLESHGILHTRQLALEIDLIKREIVKICVHIHKPWYVKLQEWVKGLWKKSR